MQLFKSQCLQEHGRASPILSYRETTFGPRYGGRAAAPRTPARCVSHADDDAIVVAYALPGEPGLRHPAVHFDQAA